MRCIVGHGQRRKRPNAQTPENLLWRLDVEVGFHHPAMLPAVAQVAEWAAACGLDVEQARGIAHNILMDPVDWVAECRSMAALGVRRILEIGPSGGVTMLTQAVLDGAGIEVLDVSGAEGGVVWRVMKEIGGIFEPPDIKGYLKNISTYLERIILASQKLTSFVLTSLKLTLSGSL